MEVFIAATSEAEWPIVEPTLNAWSDCDWSTVNLVQVPASHYELQRRIVSDRMAKDDFYLLVDMGCVPSDTSLIRLLEKRLSPMDGLIGLFDGNPEVRLPHGARVCKKGVIQKWPSKVTENYDKEHADAVKLQGKRVGIWDDILFKVLPVS